MQVMSEQLARLRREDAMHAAARWRLARAARRDRRLGQFAALPLFAGLTLRQLLHVGRHADPFTRPDGATLASERRPERQLVVITRGIAEATLDGKRVAMLGPGDHFGELTLLGGPAPLVPTVTALTPIEGFAFSSRGFWSVVRAAPAVAVRLAMRLAEQRYASAGRNEPVAEPHDHASKLIASTP